MRRLSVLICLIWAMLFPEASAGTVRILPLGDSLTDGYGIPGSYRARLYSLLVNAGYSVNFVGTLRDATTTGLPDVDHEGHIGYRIDQVDAYIANWLGAVEGPDVVLLLLGTNDYVQNYDTTHAINRLENLVAHIATLRPNASIIVANLVIMGGSGVEENAAQSTYNPYVSTMVARQAALGRRVSFVDMHSCCGLSDLYDALHPNQTGFNKMADKWYAALTTVLGPASPVTQPVGASSFANGSFESGYTAWTGSGNQAIGAPSAPFVPSDGTRMAVFNGGQTVPNGALSQTFTTTPGQAYALAFDAGVIAYNQNEQRMLVTVNGNNVLLSRTVSMFGTGNGTTKWFPQSFTFTADAATATVTFRDVSQVTSAIDLLLDNVRVMIPGTPPPSTSPPATTVSSFTNGSFEPGYTPWTASGNQRLVTSNTSVQATDGTQLIIFNGGDTTPNGVISEAFQTIAGQSYTVTFDIGVLAYNYNEQRLLVSARGNGTLLQQTVSVYGSGNGSTKWSTRTASFTADSSTTILTFQDVSPTSAALDLMLDNVRVSTGGSALASPGAGIVSNGSFESGATGWVFTGNGGVIPTVSAFRASNGTYLAAFNRGDSVPNAIVSQSFPTVVGQNYTLSFDAGVLGYNQSEQRLQTAVRGNNVRLARVVSVYGNGLGTTKWSPQSFDFTADSTVTTLVFQDSSLSTAAIDLLLDNVRVVAR